MKWWGLLWVVWLSCWLGVISGQSCPTGADIIPNCASCTTATGGQIVCATCLNGFYLLNTNCIACTAALPNCLNCETNAAN